MDGRSTERAPVPTAAVLPGKSIRTRAVVVYLLLAGLVLIPGALLKLGFDGLLPAFKPWFDTLRAPLDDIRFGHGLRFWLGVTGATMLGLLLFYPLRKALGVRSWIGRIASWFHLHIVFGIAGPVAIAYHANFGQGGTNANLALWAMVIVAVSGIIGHFVYASASAEFYRGKLLAREQIDAIAGLLTGLDAMHDSRRQILADLAAFETALLTPRQGVIASVMARLRMETGRRRLSRALGWHLSECANQLHLADEQHGDLRALASQHLAAYIRIARHAASRSVREQIWARWRLFHLPVFLIMVVATVLHVVAVWDMDAAPVPRAAVRPGSAASKAGEPIAGDVKRVLSIPVTPGKRSDAGGTNVPRPQTITRRVASTTDSTSGETSSVPKPGEAPTVQAAPVVIEKPPADIDTVYKELARRTETSPPMPNPMALGGAKPRTLTEQIVAYKALQKSRQFAHTEGETGFALTGRHVKLECTDCHTAPLSEARSTSPRACIACHKGDDIHRGRRPACAQCHTTNRFSERLPGK